MDVKTIIGFVKDDRFSRDKFVKFSQLANDRELQVCSSSHIPSIPGVPRENEINHLSDPILLVFGGDGTMLRALKRHANLPTVGINCGSFGFLCEFEANELEMALDFLCKHDWETQKTNIIRGSYDNKSYQGINECVISGADTGRPVDLRVLVNGVTMMESRGDGLIVSTPNGSTAYNIAAGGAVINPSLAAVAITPIAPFMTMDRSVILSHDKVIEIVNLERNRSCKVFYDGVMKHRVGPGERFVIENSQNKSVFLRRPASFSRRMSLKISNRYPIR